MRAYVPDFELKSPRDLREVLEVLSRAPAEWRPFAGGTDLMVQFEAGVSTHRCFISLWGLAELKGIAVSPDYVTIGALETYSDIRAHELLGREFPLLGRAARETGALAIQNRGTIGGNIANASPAADTPPVLLAYDAEVSLLSLRGSRWVSYADFHTGYKRTLARADEIIEKIRLKRVSDVDLRSRWHFYRKVGTRRAQAISKVCLAGLIEFEGGPSERTEGRVVREARVALGSVGPVPLRARAVERVLQGAKLDAALIARAIGALATDIAPIDDIRSTGRYRRGVAERVLAEFLSPQATPHRVAPGVGNVELDQ